MTESLPKSGVAAVIVAAGKGERAGVSSDGPKQYRSAGGRPVIWHTLTALLRHTAISSIIVVIHADDDERFAKAWPGNDMRVRRVFGGANRQASVYAGLVALKDCSPDFVLIHDAVRPFVSQALLDRIIGSLTPSAGILPALPVSETVKRADGAALVIETVPRINLFTAQTPQGFPFKTILQAHERAAQSGMLDLTDDASIAEWFGLPVSIVEGASENIKLTWKRDIEMADQKLGGGGFFPDVRTGNGYDVHALEPGSHVTLCGIEIKHSARLMGHSDADVALHALTDALLATRGAGDIGTHFPPSEAKWKGASSRIFVEHAAKLVRDGGGRIANVDVTLICEEPKIGPHRLAMIAALADMLNIAPERVSVKATTNEKLGFIGRSEGIAAIATASVAYPGFLE